MKTKPRWYTTAATVLALSLLAAAAQGCSAPRETVTILVAFTPTETTIFKNEVTKPFNRANPGVQVNVESTRALAQEITADQQQGELPQLAALPSIGALAQYKHDRYPLQNLDPVITTSDYGPPWSSFMRLSPHGHAYAVPIKVDVKSLIWYDPAKSHAQALASGTWSQLPGATRSGDAAGRAPWCLALSSAPTSGWPGTDWIADIMLNRYPREYRKWAAGRLSWTSGPVRDAWLMWGHLLSSGKSLGELYGGPGRALTTPVGTKKFNPASSGCTLAHGALVDEAFTKSDHYHGDYAFAAPPAGTPVQVSADFAVMFKNTSGTAKFMKYMTQPATQRRWVDTEPAPRTAGLPGTLSADKQVQPGDYPKGVTRDIAKLLFSQRQLCFGASDSMPPALSEAFDNAVLDYISAPDTLTSKILPELERVRQDAEAEEDHVPALHPVCGTPYRNG